MILDRNDYKTAIPQLEKRLQAVEEVGSRAIENIDILSTLLDEEALERERLYQKSATQMAQIITDFDADIESLQHQIDGNITTWFFDYVPTNENYPASAWIEAGTENVHLGDLFYNTTTGYAYRWLSDGNEPPVYSWARITDTDVTKALADAAAAQDTADHKRRVFVSTPVVPYDIGDLWCEGLTGDILTCTNPKTDAQSYAYSDWIKLNKYTDDTVANQAKTAADAAQASADEAQAYAEAAQISAGEAAVAATSAYNSASQAIDQLGIVQDVVGVLDLISKNGEYQHTLDDEPLEDKWYFLREGSGTTADPYRYVMPQGVEFTYFLTSDVAIDANKTYYARSGQGTEEDPYVYAVVETPVVADIGTYYENTRQDYYELVGVDQSIQNYISAHLALVGDSLYLQNGATRVQLSTTEGMILYNESGDQVARYGRDTIIGDINTFGIKIGESPESTQQNPVYELGFYQDGNRVAYINNNSLYITQTVVLRQMQMGDSQGVWAWCVHEVNNLNNLYLKWLG